ncbi:MAG: acyl-CoA dehydrogenase family protein, partial [Anaerolineae bacterium]
HLAFRLVELIGLSETGRLDAEGTALLRLLTAVTKLTTARQAVAAVSEAIEAFGGAGYVEDTGLPVLLRDAQVLSIWEGTTNVLSLEALRALKGGAALAAFKTELAGHARAARESGLVDVARHARAAAGQAEAWLTEAMRAGQPALEAGARRFAITLGRSLALALLVRQAQWSLDNEGDSRAAAAARRFAQHGVTLITLASLTDARALAGDLPLPAPEPAVEAPMPV